VKRRAKARAEQRWDVNRSAKWQARVAKEFERLVSTGALRLWQTKDGTDRNHVGYGCLGKLAELELLGVSSSPEVEILFDPENPKIVYVRATGPSGALGRFPTASFLCPECFDILWNRHVLHKDQSGQG
jgi:hypothetical protein